MTSATAVTGTGTGPVRVRVCAVLVHDGRICLIRRQRPAGLQLSLPGGLIEPGEDPPTALRRELLEELGFDTATLPAPPVLRFTQDQETLRPGESAPFRRRHLVFTAHLPTGFHLAVAATEQDDPHQPPVVWVPAAAAACLHLYPAIGPALDQALRPDTTTNRPLLLPAMTGASYQWR
ncbi:NUDIX hydrolase [Kitasatospora sp. NBC_01287]|uniref:NUDIX hydrolase n=1 Tax=Kitasatospora sp. NBC_01287 TaxID=2903573 RepID=UPI002254D4E9|nr:NUDIX hydrolase [Kitasatospora sp. NBC_01287]MCX4743938.1 NUDIX hydrolase [Kitasatospora sp. NBC_01287]